MSTHPYQDLGEGVEARVADLLDRMTIEEKVGQLLVEPATGSVDEVVAE
jgi:hypothetical protein